uniref:Putative HNH homing endonuclease n=1 Tax=Pediastrum duplex TaxID=3105 RepID=A0A2U8GIQ5_PEDDU|nr:putative HNH homing endonuclease [Pediastrum duplex]
MACLPEASTHYHHIYPKHDGGSKNGPTVKCTIRDHACAHKLRFIEFGQIKDFCAYSGLCGRTDELDKEIKKLIVQTNRERGNCMFNKAWQIEMANRPKKSYYFQQNPEFARSLASEAGKKGGKTMTPKKQEVLKQNGFNVGMNHGCAGGIKHQHPKTSELLSKSIEWVHTSGLRVISPPCEAVEELKLRIFKHLYSWEYYTCKLF